MIFLIIGSIGNFFIPQKSPQYLHKKGKLDQLIITLKSISKINKNEKSKAEIRQNLNMPSYDFKNYKYKIVGGIGLYEKIGSQIKIFKSILKSEFIFMLLGFMIEFTSQFIMYNGTSIAVAHLGLDNIQINGILLGITSCIGSLAILPVSNSMKRKLFSQISLLSIVFIGFIIGIISKYLQNFKYSSLFQTILTTIVIVMITSGLCCIMYTHLLESFPVKIRGLAFAIVILTSKTISSLSSYLLDYSDHLGYNSLVICCLISLIPLPFTYFFKETKTAETKNERNSSIKMVVDF